MGLDHRVTARDRAGRPPTSGATDALVGRDEHLRVLVDLLTQPHVPLVSITGPSGVGKSRLARAALDRLRPTPGIVVALESVPDATLLRDAVVAAVSPDGTSAGGPADAAWERFGGGPVVLLLDDVEQVAGAGPVVSDLLQQYPAATVLATGLRPTGLPGERVLRLPPLPVPDARDTPPEPTAAPAPALTLFRQRAEAADAFLEPDADWLAAAGEVCRLVGGLPLAIELAAARAATVPPTLMAAQLTRTGGLGLLRTTGDAADRHDSLEAALRWTVALLPPATVDLFTAMSVFEGPVGMDAVSAVSPNGTDVLDAVADLVDLHLVEMDLRLSHDPRFRLLPPVRAYARDRLAASGRLPGAIARHDAWVRGRARAGSAWDSDEVADLLATLDRSRLAGEVDSALELALWAADRVVSPGAQASVGSRVGDLLDGGQADPVLQARALVWSVSHGPAEVGDRQAYAAWTQRRVEEAISAARRSGDDAALLDALELTVRTLMVTLDRDLALSGVQEGLAVAQRVGDDARLARFRMWAGMGAQAAGYGDQAALLLRQAWTGGTAAGDRVAADYAAMFLHAQAVYDQRVIDLDLPPLPDLLAAAWAGHDLFAAAYVLSLLLAGALAAGDVAGAARYLGQLVPIGIERLGTEPMMPARILAVAVCVFVAAGRLEVAARLQQGLASLDPVLRNSMAATEYAAYARAVAVIPDRAAPPAPDGSPLTPMTEALRMTEREAWSIVTTAHPHAEPSARPVVEVDPPSLALLTSREREVLVKLAGGAGNKQIGRDLGITPKTVMHHTVAIYRKLGVRGRAEAAAVAVRAGLASSE